MNNIDFKELNENLLNISEQLLYSWLPGGAVKGKEYTCSSINGGQGKSFNVNIQTGQWFDFADDSMRGGDLISLYAMINRITQIESAQKLQEEIGIKPSNSALTRLKAEPKKPISSLIPEIPEQAPLLPTDFFTKGNKRKPDHLYTYNSRSGSAIMYIARFNLQGNKKTFVPVTFQGNRWIKKGYKALRPLYRLDQIVNESQKPIVICEGEKAADAMQIMGDNKLIATTWPNGASAVNRADWTPLFNRKILIWPDKDKAGYKARDQIIEILRNKADILKYIDVENDQDLPEKGDAADFGGISFGQWQAWCKPLKVSVNQLIEKIPDPEPLPELLPEPAPVNPEKEQTVSTNNEVWEPIGGYTYKKVTSNGKSTFMRDHNSLREALEQDSFYKVLSDNGVVRAFNGRFYEDVSKFKIISYAEKKFSEAHNAPLVKESDRKEFYYKVLAHNVFDREDIDVTKLKWLVNLNNGVFNLSTNELLPHSHVYDFDHCLPHNYEPKNTSCPTWDKMMKNFTCDRPEIQQTLEEYLAYCIFNIPFAHLTKTLVLISDGKNGKSTVMNAFKMLVGDKNTTGVTFTDLQSDKFAGHSLKGKLLNLAGEEEKGAFARSSIFKKITGGDPIHIQQKGVQGASVTLSIKHIVSSNDVIALPDSSKGMIRRLLMIPCDMNGDDPNVRIDNLEEKLLAEAPAILNRVIKAARDLRDRGEFEEPKGTGDRLKEMIAEGDPFYDWLWYSGEVEIVRNPARVIEANRIYYNYLNSTEGSRSKLTPSVFGRRLSKEITNALRLPKEVPVRYRSGTGKRERYYKYIAFHG